MATDPVDNTDTVPKLCRNPDLPNAGLTGLAIVFFTTVKTVDRLSNGNQTVIIYPLRN
jgi:hypothetical protein